MPTFIVTYPSGVEESEIVEECETVEQYANRKFGSVDYKEFGTSIRVEGDEEPAQEEPAQEQL